MRTVQIKLLPDGSGRVRIHWFQRLPPEQAPINRRDGVVLTGLGPLVIEGAHGQIACMPDRQDIGPKTVNGVIERVIHSDDGRAVTCPECMATEEFKAWMRDVELIVPTAQATA